MNIGLFGGSFNPIHNAHILLARTILRQAGLDEVWFLVSPQNPLKFQASLLGEDMRYEMVSLAIADEEGLVASDYEFHLSRPSFTWNTLQHLKTDYPQHRFSLLIGGDNWALFDKWAYHDDILRDYEIFIYPRSGSIINEATLPHNVSVIPTPEIDITSTEVRQMIAEGKDIDALVPDVVANIIRERNYYMGNNG